MSRALEMLEEHGLLNGCMNPEHLERGMLRFFAFSRNLIVENDLVRDVLAQSNREFEPLHCETADQLITEVLPLGSR
jgi:hypothetical protein